MRCYRQLLRKSSGEIQLRTGKQLNFSSERSRTVSTQFYRLFLRQCAELQAECHEQRFLLQPPITKESEGLYCLNPIQEATAEDIIHAFRDTTNDSKPPDQSKPQQFYIRVIKMDSFAKSSDENETSSLDKSLEEDDGSDTDDDPVFLSKPSTLLAPSLWCTSIPTLQTTIRNGFLSSSSTAEAIPAPNHLLAVYQAIARQQRLWNRTVVNVENCIRITGVAQVISSSNYNSKVLRYGYRIRVENLHETDAIQLLGRSWTITTVGRSPLFVNAPNGGCVGQHPKIDPGHVFEYQSAAEANNEGSLEGELYFASEKRGAFTAHVPPVLFRPDN